jgi:hypothetical protein
MIGLSALAARQVRANDSEVSEISWRNLVSPYLPQFAQEEIILRANGTATRIRIIDDAGARRRVEESGKLDAQEFDRVCALLQKNDFLNLQDFRPHIYPTEAFSTSVVSNGQRKSVLRWGKALAAEPAPAGLLEIEQAIKDLGAGIKWQIDTKTLRTGVRGVAVENHPKDQTGKTQSLAFAGARIQIRPLDNSYTIAAQTTDGQGRFEINVPPGTYRIVGLRPAKQQNTTLSHEQTVTVGVDQFVEVKVQYDASTTF